MARVEIGQPQKARRQGHEFRLDEPLQGRGAPLQGQGGLAVHCAEHHWHHWLHHYHCWHQLRWGPPLVELPLVCLHWTGLHLLRRQPSAIAAVPLAYVPLHVSQLQLLSWFRQCWRLKWRSWNNSAWPLEMLSTGQLRRLGLL